MLDGGHLNRAPALRLRLAPAVLAEARPALAVMAVAPPLDHGGCLDEPQWQTTAVRDAAYGLGYDFNHCRICGSAFDFSPDHS